MTVQPHDPGTMPFGAHDVTEEPVIDHSEDHALSRLVGIGFTEEQAAAFITDHGVSTVRSASDSALSRHLQVAQAASEAFDPSGHKIADVLDYVDGDPAKAAAVAAAERDAVKPRVTLLEQLDELAASAVGLGEDSTAGAATNGEADAPDSD